MTRGSPKHRLIRRSAGPVPRSKAFQKQMFIGIGGAAWAANSDLRNHPPGKTFRVPPALKDFVNHGNPRVPAGARGCADARLRLDRHRNRRDEASTMAAKAKKTDADEEEEGEATEETAESGEGEKPKGRFSLKLILMMVGGVAVLGGGGTGAYLMLGGSKETKPAVAVVKPPAFL